MIRAKLLYLLLVTGLVGFYILYIDSVPLLMLICVLIIPLFLKAGLLWLHWTADCELHCCTDTCTVGESVPITVLLHSKCPLFFPKAEAWIQILHGSCRKPELLRLKFPVQAKNATRLTFYIHADYCGTAQIRLSKLRVYDVFRLFHTNVHIDSQTADMLVLPQPLDLQIQNTVPPIEQLESERYANKPGDDSSEIFAIREYMPGDQVSRMHWKLSSRSDVLLVKDFSMPILKNMLLFVEYVPVKDRKYAQELLTLYYSVALYLVQSEQICELGWYDDAAKEIVTCKPDSEYALAKAFGRLYQTLPVMKPCSVLFREMFAGRSYSSITVVTNDAHTNLLPLLEYDMNANQKNLIVIHAAVSSLSSETVTVVCVQPEDMTMKQQLVI